MKHVMRTLMGTEVVRRKIPWRMSKSRKANQRKRLKLVDSVIETVRASGVKCNALVSALLAPNLANLLGCTQDKALLLPKEHEMLPKDKYTVFSRNSRGFRKGIHKVPKFTRVRGLVLHREGSHIDNILR